MDITNQVKEIKRNLKLIGKLEREFGLKPNYGGNDDPLLYCGVANSDIILKLTPLVEEYFDKPYKASGESAFFKNLFDPFIKSVGGIRTDQTLYKKDIDKGVILFCAFWPWGSDPIKTSIRVGLICYQEEVEKEYTKYLKGYF